MTTAFGLHAFDPKESKEYIMMAADSQVSSTKKNKFHNVDSYNATKFIKNKHCLILYSGTYLKGNRDILKVQNSYNNLVSYEIFDTSNLIKNLEQISREIKNKYIIGTNFGDQLTLSYYGTRINLLKGRIFLPDNRSQILNAFIGSGSTFAYDIMQPELDKCIKIDGIHTKLIMPLEDMTDLAVEAMNQASIKDEFTGGHMDMMVLTKTKIELFRKYAALFEDSRFL